MSSNDSIPTPGEVIGVIEEFAGVVRMVKLFSLASMVLYVYNYILTFKSEVSVMWKANMGLGKILFFVLRYCTLFSSVILNIGLHIPGLSSEMCSARNIFYWVSAVIIALATDFILQLRVYALYQGSRRILCLIILSSCAMVASFATFLTIILRADHEVMTYYGPGTNLYICEGSRLPDVYDKIWVAKLVNEALMFILALWKGITSVKEYNGMCAARQLMVFLVKDSVLYFFVVFAFCLLSQLVWTYAGQHYVEVSIGMTLAVGSIMSQGLVINIRKQFMERQKETLSTARSGTLAEHPSVFEYSFGEEMSVTMAETYSEAEDD